MSPLEESAGGGAVTSRQIGGCDERYLRAAARVFRATRMRPLPAATPGPLPDAALVDRMARRDATALIELERRHGPSLYALVYGILMDAGRAERVVAEVFDQVWHAAALLTKRHRGAYSWLQQAAKERARMHRAATDSP